MQNLRIFRLHETKYWLIFFEYNAKNSEIKEILRNFKPSERGGLTTILPKL